MAPTNESTEELVFRSSSLNLDRQTLADLELVKRVLG